MDQSILINKVSEIISNINLSPYIKLGQFDVQINGFKAKELEGQEINNRLLSVTISQKGIKCEAALNMSVENKDFNNPNLEFLYLSDRIIHQRTMFYFVFNFLHKFLGITIYFDGL